MTTYLIFHLVCFFIFHFNHVVLKGSKFTTTEVLLSLTIAPIAYVYQLYAIGVTFFGRKP